METQKTQVGKADQNEFALVPVEVQELAANLSEVKQKEISDILVQIFAGTNDWEKQIDAIEVKDINDKMSIQMADAARKNVKNARLIAEKIFDAKRESVQKLMSDFKLEDSLWLKTKQITQLKFKVLEEKAEWKANFVKRYEAEQKELQAQLRIEKVSKFSTEINRIEFENMSKEMFDIFIDGLEKSHIAKIEAQKEAEAQRIKIEAETKLHHDRKESILHLWNFLADEAKTLHFGEFHKDEWDEFVLDLNEKKAKYDEEQARIKAENERLAKERADLEAKAKAKELEAEKERKRIEAERAKERAEADRKQRELEQQLKAKEEADKAAKSEADRKERERIAAEKKAATAPDKDKLTAFVNSLTLPQIQLK